MNLTREQRKRLAREMRKLAMECVDNGPAMENVWRGCAIGISLKRAGLWVAEDKDIWTPEYMDAEGLAVSIDDLLVDDENAAFGVVSLAVLERIWKANPTAVVFPLLALADAVEESEAPQAPEKSLP